MRNVSEKPLLSLNRIRFAPPCDRSSRPDDRSHHIVTGVLVAPRIKPAIGNSPRGFAQCTTGLRMTASQSKMLRRSTESQAAEQCPRAIPS